MKQSWIVVGRLSDGDEVVFRWHSAAAAHRVGRDNIRTGVWVRYTVARVTAELVRGAVRVRP